VKVKLLITFTTLVALLAPASALAGHFDGR
jgi:hypothetical protein